MKENKGDKQKKVFLKSMVHWGKNPIEEKIDKKICDTVFTCKK